MSTCDKNLPELLTRRSIFDKILLPDSQKPKNLKAIQDAISVSSVEARGLHEQETQEHCTYCQIITEANIFESDIGSQVFKPFSTLQPSCLTIMPVEAARNRGMLINQSTSCSETGLFEELSNLLLLEWVKKHLWELCKINCVTSISKLHRRAQS
jgi:hypothetical protein